MLADRIRIIFVVGLHPNQGASALCRWRLPEVRGAMDV
jgi:hypothetical protein